MLKIRDIMTRAVVTVDPELSIRDAMELLTKWHVGGAPVVAGRQVIGVISMTDLVHFAVSLPASISDRFSGSAWEKSNAPMQPEDDADAAFFAELWSDEGDEAVEQFEAVSGLEWSVLGEHTVREAMTLGARSLGPGADALEAAAIMTNERIHRIVVMDGEQLVGIVSLTDIARAAAERRLSTGTYSVRRDFDKRDSSLIHACRMAEP